MPCHWSRPLLPAWLIKLLAKGISVSIDAVVLPTADRMVTVRAFRMPELHNCHFTDDLDTPWKDGHHENEAIESATSSTTQHSSAQAPCVLAVLNTPELLEKILLELEHIHDIMHCKAVNHQFRSTISESPSFRFLPSLCLAEHGVPENIIWRRKPFLRSKVPFSTCVNPLLVMPVEFQSTNPSRWRKDKYWFARNIGYIVFTPGYGKMHAHAKANAAPFQQEAMISDKQLLESRIAHPCAQVGVEILLGYKDWLYGQIKSETTIQEFLDFCDLPVEEMLESKLFFDSKRVGTHPQLL